MARKQKGGDFISNVWAGGIGAYAAKNSSSMGELIWTLVKYSIVILAILLAIYLVSWLFSLARRDTFVPIAPSKEGDAKVTTPAGNVIMY
jgi:hypothetical protein